MVTVIVIGISDLPFGVYTFSLLYNQLRCDLWKIVYRQGHLLSSCQTMHTFNVSIPDRPLSNIELPTFARELEIPHFRSDF